MAEITRKRTGEFLRGLFDILKNEATSMKAAVVLGKLRQQFKLTEYENGYFQSGGSRFEKIVRFATVDCVKAGWMEKNKGYWQLTDLGKKALEEFKDPETFYKEAVRLYQAWKTDNPPDTPEDSLPEEGNGEQGLAATISFEEADEHAWVQIEDHLGKMPPYDFQHLVAGLLRAMGYHVSWVAPPGKDGGVDIIATQDPLGINAPRIKVQVKRQKQPISVDGLRSFMSVLGDGDVGVFVSLGGFTREAEAVARNQETRKVTIIDAEKLTDLWIEHHDRLEEKARSLFCLRPIYFLAN